MNRKVVLWATIGLLVLAVSIFAIGRLRRGYSCANGQCSVVDIPEVAPAPKPKPEPIPDNNILDYLPVKKAEVRPTATVENDILRLADGCDCKNCTCKTCDCKNCKCDNCKGKPGYIIPYDKARAELVKQGVLKPEGYVEPTYDYDYSRPVGPIRRIFGRRR